MKANDTVELIALPEPDLSVFEDISQFRRMMDDACAPPPRLMVTSQSSVNCGLRGSSSTAEFWTRLTEKPRR